MPGHSSNDPSAAFFNVYQALRRDILAGKLDGGQALRQDDIARQHGVSKVPVREALRRLEMENLVEFLPRRGAIVRSVSDDDLLEMLDIRIALECRALELAIPNMADSDFQLAQEVLDEYQASPDKALWSELNRRFHGCILEPCGNRQLLSLINDFEQRVGPLVRLRVTEATGLERPMKEHRQILQSCREGAVNAAVDALRAHIETTKREVAASLRRRNLRGIESTG